MSRTRVLTVNPNRPELHSVALAADCLLGGGLVAFPTETVYGLGANAFDAEAVRGIFRAKGRPASDPLIVHLHRRAQLQVVTGSLSRLAEALVDAFWPGPLTLVLPGHASLPAEVVAGGATVAVRMPSHPVARALLAAVDVPVAAPSANRFARPSPTTAQHVLDDLDGEVDIILDGGPVTIGVESTIVDLTQDPPTLLRPGGLTLEALRRVAPAVTVRSRYLSREAAAVEAPGQFLKHYSPRAEVRLLEGAPAAALDRMKALAQASLNDGRKVGLVLADEEAQSLGKLPVEVARLGPLAEPEAAGRQLFAALRDLDQRGVDVILARLPERAGLGLAIWDRLYRAAEGRVVRVED